MASVLSSAWTLPLPSSPAASKQLSNLLQLQWCRVVSPAEVEALLQLRDGKGQGYMDAQGDSLLLDALLT